MFSPWVVAALVVDVVAFLLTFPLRRQNPDLGFEAVGGIAIVAAVLVGAGVGVGVLLGGAGWPLIPGYVVSGFVGFIMVLKSHRPVLRFVSGGRLARVTRFSSITGLERRAAAAVEPELRAFVEGGWERYDGRIASELPSYQSDADTGIAVRFGDIEVVEQAADWEVDWTSFAGWIPFALLVSPKTDERESQFLVVRADAPHAVAMWEHETGKLDDAFPTLAAFLTSLR